MDNNSKPSIENPKESVAPASYQSSDSAQNLKIIKIFAIAGGAFVLLAISLIVLVFLLAVDYREAYELASTLRMKMSDIYSSSSCEEVADYVSRPNLSETKYESYISACRESAELDDDLIRRLGETDGVRRNREINEQFRAFQDAYAAGRSSDADFEKKLDTYKSWHSFLYRKYKLTTSSPEKDYREAAEYAKATGNEVLAEYGEEWLKLTLAYRSAYQAYWGDKKAGDSEYRALTAARSALQEYVRDHEPDIEDEVPLMSSDSADTYRTFEKLYDLIRFAYDGGYDGPYVNSYDDDYWYSDIVPGQS